MDQPREACIHHLAQASLGIPSKVEVATGPDDPRPQMFSAVQDMPGLKLERAKGLVDVLIIEHVEKPSEN